VRIALCVVCELWMRIRSYMYTNRRRSSRRQNMKSKAFALFAPPRF
jgi:hypothetical protein